MAFAALALPLALGAGGAVAGVATGASTLATAGLGLGAAGAGLNAVGALTSSEATAANANYQAQVAKNNAITASQNAEYATEAGAEKATEQSLKAREQLGAVRTAIAASGLDVNTGSAADIQRTQRETGALATGQVVNNAALQAYGYRTQATGYQAQAGLEEQEAAQAPIAGGISAAGGLLGGASSLGLNYTILQQLAGGGGVSPLSPGANPSYGGAAAAGGLT